MNLRKILASAAVAVATLSATTVATAAPASAASCGPERQLASRPTTLKGSFGTNIGVLYIGYIPSCRMEYAELHFNDNLDSTTYGSGSIWLEDAAGHTAGKVYFGGGDASGYRTSGLVYIGHGTGDGFGYAKSIPHVYMDWVTGWSAGGLGGGQLFPHPVCLTNHNWHGNYHNFYTGYNDNGHSSEGC